MRIVRQLAALAEIARARVLLKLVSLPTALRWNAVRIRTGPLPALEENPLEFLAWAGSKIPGGTCLPRALAAQRLLARAGRRGTIVFGVRRKSDGSLDAHAWLEENGRVVCGETADLGAYARLTPEQWAGSGRGRIAT